MNNPPHSLREVPSLGREGIKGWVPSMLRLAIPLRIVVCRLTLPADRVSRSAALDGEVWQEWLLPYYNNDI